MKITYDTMVLYEPGKSNMKDTVENGKCSISGQPVEDAMKENPNLILISFNKFLELQDNRIQSDYLNKAWEQCEEHDYQKSFNTLPPEKYETLNTAIIFRSPEYFESNVTVHYIFLYGRYYYAYRRTSQSYDFLLTELATQFNKLLPGTKVIKSSYPGTIIREYPGEDIYEIRLESGDVCCGTSEFEVIES